MLDKLERQKKEIQDEFAKRREQHAKLSSDLEQVDKRIIQLQGAIQIVEKLIQEESPQAETGNISH